MKRLLLLVLALFLVACGGRGPQASSVSIDDVLAEFEEAGLECVDPQPEEQDGASPRPNTFDEAIRCVVPSVDEDHGLRVFRFSSPENLRHVQDYYEGFSGMLGSYVYTNGNLLIQTSTTMPVDLAERYEEALQAVGE